MSQALSPHIPDVAKNQAPLSIPLDQVGMAEVFLPLQISAVPGASPLMLNARLDMSINLIQKEKRGIHMSRLYRISNDELTQKPLTEELLRQVLEKFLTSQEGLGDTAYLNLSFELPRSQKALLSELAGWKGYPIRICCVMNDSGNWDMQVHLRVDYSSTCPCSSALAKGHIKDLFISEFSGREQLSFGDMEEWLDRHALAATPHGQRSHCDAQVKYHDHKMNLEATIVAIEESLTTPTQTAVKRQDEQRFAVLSGQNPMFAEDAARRVALGLKNHESVARFKVRVSHYESLHSHDAFAAASSDSIMSSS